MRRRGRGLPPRLLERRERRCGRGLLPHCLMSRAEREPPHFTLYTATCAGGRRLPAQGRGSRCKVFGELCSF